MEKKQRTLAIERELQLLAEEDPRLASELTVLSSGDITRAILAHRHTHETKGLNLREIIEDILNEFRASVSERGYLGIDKKIVPLVQAYGTIRDKAILCVIGYFDRDRDEGRRAEASKAIVSRTRLEEIRKEIRTQGREAKVEYMEYLTKYDSLLSVFDLFYRIKYSYFSAAYQGAIYIITSQTTQNSTRLFKSFMELLGVTFDICPDGARQEILQRLQTIGEAYSKRMEALKDWGEVKEKSGDNWEVSQIEDCLSYGLELITIANSRLQEYKGAVEALNEWIAQEAAAAFVPMELREQLADLETMSYIPELPIPFHRKYIEEKSQRGEFISDSEILRAILYDYDNSPINEEIKNIIITKLNGYKESHKYQ